MRIRFRDMHTSHTAHVRQATFSQAWRTVDIGRDELAQIVRRWRSPMTKKAQ
jgi:hypothetical protein